MTQKPNKQNTRFSSEIGWRHALLFFIVIGSLTLMLSMPPFGQDLAYHDFGDRRTFFGIPNFFDVMSNIPFLLVGMAGMGFCYRNRWISFRPAWLTFFTGMALVSMGSGYYHWNPDNGTLVWDRLPMTIGFMGLFAVLLSEYVSAGLGRFLLLPVILMGLYSVLHWHRFDDLRFYVWIQFVPLLTVPVLMALFSPKYSHQGWLMVALAFYLLAKLAEAYDRELFLFTHNHFSGHSLKHLLAASGCLSVLVMLKKRKPLDDGRAPH